MPRARSEDRFTKTELSGGRERSILAVEYQEKKEAEKKEKELKKLAGNLGVDEEWGEKKPEIKKLSTLHKVILGMSMTGMYSQTEIGRKLGVSNGTVWRVLNSSLGRELREEWQQAVEVEMEGLYPLAVDAIREGLQAGDKKTRLLAVDRFTKLSGRGETGGTDVTVNVVTGAREKFITELKQIAEQEKVLEGEFEEKGAE